MSVGRVEGSDATKRHEAARSRRRRIAGSLALSVFVVGNAVAMLWIWGAGGSDGIGYHWHSFDAALLSLGRITALLAGYLALVEVLLLARLPFLERLVGFDRLTHLAPLERACGARSRARARRVLGLGVREARQAVVVSGVLELADAAPARRHKDRRPRRRSRNAVGQPRLQTGQPRHRPPDDGDVSLPGDHHRDDRHRPADRRRRHLAGRRAPKALLRVVVCDPLHRLRGDRARVVPHDPRRQRVRDRQDRRRLLAQPLRASGRTRPLLPRRTTARTQPLASTCE